MSPEFFDAALVWALRVLYALAILLAGLWLAVFLSRVARGHAEKNPRIDTTLGAFLARAVRYVLIAIVIIIVLQMFGVQTASLVAVLGASALAIGLALQGTLTNVASGIIVALLRPYHIGDYVEIKGKEGLVTDLDLFFTEIRSPDNRRIVIPNGQVISSPIVNHTTAGKRCCALTVGVADGVDLDQALAVLKRTMLSDRRASNEPRSWFGVRGLAASSVDLAALVWVKGDDYEDYRSDMLKVITPALGLVRSEDQGSSVAAAVEEEIPQRSDAIPAGDDAKPAGTRTADRTEEPGPDQEKPRTAFAFGRRPNPGVD